MKFKIRFADQIVGFFVVLSLVCLTFVVILLGRSQRWFTKDVSYRTVLQSAGGLSKNMAVQYRGFTVGSIKSFQLTDDDNVEVVFLIHEDYKDRVRLGSLVEMMISPIGLGNQFLFHPGKGDLLPHGALIPVAGSVDARELQRQGLAVEAQHDDSINLLMSRVLSILDDAGRMIADVTDAIGSGSDTEIGLIVGSLQKTLAGAEGIPQTLDNAVATAVSMIDNLQDELKSILGNVDALTSELNNPDGLVYTVLDTDKDVYKSLVKSLNSVSGMLDSLDRTVAFIPGQLPQVAALITDLTLTLRTAEDVLTALTNNPLLKGGIPERPETQGAAPRGINF
jgi:phospholipid/cholesterol/gamma-HCH transport system substrate-binding protein